MLDNGKEEIYLADRGVCFFAYNNNQIDYIALTMIAARYVKRYLGLPVCVITDEGTHGWMNQTYADEAEKYVDFVVITKDNMKQNMRKHWDSPWTEFAAQFNNSNKHKIWDYSPFEKTLLLDIDYIVKTDFLLQAFEYNGVAMFDHALSIRNDLPYPNERRLYDIGVKMWWSTVVYFDRSEFSKLFFDTWAHVADNYDFYQYLYNFPGTLFRTDYCVSIAAHILHGMEDIPIIHNFDNQPMYYMSQQDDIHGINNEQDWIFFATDTKENWKNILVKHSNLDLHVMNKRALGRIREQLVGYLDE
jgi:hypothetical protein